MVSICSCMYHGRRCRRGHCIIFYIYQRYNIVAQILSFEFMHFPSNAYDLFCTHMGLHPWPVIGTDDASVIHKCIVRCCVLQNCGRIRENCFEMLSQLEIASPKFN